MKIYLPLAATYFLPKASKPWTDVHNFSLDKTFLDCRAQVYDTFCKRQPKKSTFYYTCRSKFGHLYIFYWNVFHWSFFLFCNVKIQESHHGFLKWPKNDTMIFKSSLHFSAMKSEFFLFMKLQTRSVALRWIFFAYPKVGFHINDVSNEKVLAQQPFLSFLP